MEFETLSRITYTVRRNLREVAIEFGYDTTILIPIFHTNVADLDLKLDNHKIHVKIYFCPDLLSIVAIGHNSEEKYELIRLSQNDISFDLNNDAIIKIKDSFFKYLCYEL